MEKKVLLFLFALILSVSFISAINLEVSSKPIRSNYILELNEPAEYEITIKNLEEPDSFEIYSLIGVDIYPNNTFNINKQETKTINLQIVPQEALKLKKGSLNFEYALKNSKGEVQKQTITINILNLQDAFIITSDEISPKSDTINIYVKNDISNSFENLGLELKSAFFDKKDTLTFEGLETKTLTVNIDKDKSKTLLAGKYIADAIIEYRNESLDKEFTVKFIESDEIKTTESNEGIIIQTTKISKKNTGNTVRPIVITLSKNYLSLIFTSINLEPTDSELSLLGKKYIWEKNLSPNEEMNVVATTNWIYLILVVVLILILLFLIRKYIRTDVILKKQVSFVKTHGGQFALRVSIRIKAKRAVEGVTIIDRLPQLVELYEKFGAVAPDKVDTKNRKLEWNVESMDRGEEKIFSYIIYSKRVGVVGRFELPNARAVYEVGELVKEVFSNRSFFYYNPQKHKL